MINVSSQDYNDQVEKLYKADQEERFANLFESDPQGFLANEEKRSTEARKIYKLLKENTIQFTPENYARLAMIFHHRDSEEDYKIALELANLAKSRGVEGAKWLSCAIEDRLLLCQGKPQIWGTQFEKDTAGNWKYAGNLAPDNASGITDEMRAESNIPIRAEQLKSIEAKYPTEAKRRHKAQ